MSGHAAGGRQTEKQDYLAVYRVPASDHLVFTGYPGAASPLGVPAGANEVSSVH